MESITQLGFILKNAISGVYLLVVDKNGSRVALENSDGLVHEFDEQYVVTSGHMELVCDDIAESFDERRLKLKKFESIKHMPGVEKDLNQDGVKDDGGKPDIRLLFQDFPRALLAIAENATYGSVKYTPHGWRSVPDGFNRYTSAMGRHLMLESIDEGGMDADPREYGFEISHMAMVAWNAMARLELYLAEQESEKTPE